MYQKYRKSLAKPTIIPDIHISFTDCLLMLHICNSIKEFKENEYKKRNSSDD
jgi:hypothetical protein